MEEKTKINYSTYMENSHYKSDIGAADSSMLSKCDSKHHLPMGRTGPLIAKIPVVLANPEVRIELESEVTLQNDVKDIIAIKKHIYLTECKIIPHTEQLFIQGYVQKNIQFTTHNNLDTECVSENIKHISVKLPFKCVSEIQFSFKPIYESEYVRKINSIEDDSGKNEETWIHFNKPYEAIKCELDSSKIVETNWYDMRKRHNDEESFSKPFRNLAGRMVLYLKLLVLQEQSVFIAEPDEDVLLIGKVQKEDDCDSIKPRDDKYPDVLLGYDRQKGAVIAREI